jgi:DNA-binding NarL/FixJ family response regulator
VRIVIGEDEPLLREGLGLVLERHGFVVLDAVGDALSLRRRAVDLAPDLVITDIRMPPHHADDGLRAAIEIREALPATGIVVLSQHIQRRYAVELLSDRSGGVGYLLKQRVAAIRTFCDDLRRVATGGTVLDAEVIARMFARSARENAAVDALTSRQREVLRLIAEGRSNAAIAATLSIAEKSVVRYASQIYDALGLPHTADDHRRVLAVVRYLGTETTER